MDGWREDSGGFFCSCCGRELHSETEPCKRPVDEVDMDWSVIVQTLQDSLRFDDNEQPRVCRFNQATRQRAYETAKAFLQDAGRRARLRNSREA